MKKHILPMFLSLAALLWVSAGAGCGTIVKNPGGGGDDDEEKGASSRVPEPTPPPRPNSSEAPAPLKAPLCNGTLVKSEEGPFELDVRVLRGTPASDATTDYTFALFQAEKLLSKQMPFSLEQAGTFVAVALEASVPLCRHDVVVNNEDLAQAGSWTLIITLP